MTFAYQPAITCSKLAIKTLGQGVKVNRVNNEDTRMTLRCLYG